MQQYFKTLRTSSTGAKFAEKEQLSFQKDEYIKQLQSKYEFTNSYVSKYTAVGGIEQVAFDTVPDKTLWAKGFTEGVYRPRCGTKAGKQIQADFDECPSVVWFDMNACVGVKYCHVCIGFGFTNDTFFGFVVDDSWSKDWQAPDDCEEITASEYKRLFGDND